MNNSSLCTIAEVHPNKPDENAVRTHSQSTTCNLNPNFAYRTDSIGLLDVLKQGQWRLWRTRRRGKLNSRKSLRLRTQGGWTI
jgi:hypothetical protein